MKKLLLSALIFLLPIALSGCTGIPIPKDKQEYIGAWYLPVTDSIENPPSFNLTIYDNGQVEYSRVSGNFSKSLNGPIQSFENEDFTVGIWGFTTTFDVEKKPYKENGQWKMIVDGVELLKRNNTIDVNNETSKETPLPVKPVKDVRHSWNEAQQMYQEDADIIRLENLEYWTGLIEKYYQETGEYPFQNSEFLAGVTFLVSILVKNELRNDFYLSIFRSSTMNRKFRF